MRMSKSFYENSEAVGVVLNIQEYFNHLGKNYSHRGGFINQEGYDGHPPYLDIYKGRTVDGGWGRVAVIREKNREGIHDVTVLMPDSMSRRFRKEIKKRAGMRWWNRKRIGFLSEKEVRELSEGREIKGAYGRTTMDIRRGFYKGI